MFTFTLQYSEAMKIAKKLAHSVSKEETRYYLNGFFMHKTDGKHFAVSTDGHRMTRIEIKPSYEEGDFPDVIFPTAAIKQILSFKPERSRLDKALVTVKVDVGTHKYELGCEGVGFIGKLIDATYPDYTRVIPNYKVFRNEYGNAGFSPIYLAELFEAASYCSSTLKTRPAAVRFFFEGNNPGVVLEEKDPSVLYVIMGMRCSLPLHKHPQLAADEAEKATAA